MCKRGLSGAATLPFMASVSLGAEPETVGIHLAPTSMLFLSIIVILACAVAVFLVLHYRRRHTLLEQEITKQMRELRLKNLELTYREARLEQATQSARIGYWKADLSGQMTEKSGMFRSILGIPKEIETITRDHIVQLMNPDDRERITWQIERAQKAGKSYEVEFALHQPNGREVHIRERAEPLLDDDGAVYCFSGTCQDITTERLSSLNLMTALAEAQDANHSKSEFLANMSHELRTPLNAIIGFAESMQLGIFGDINNTRYASYIDDIQTSARHLLGIINDVLDLSRIEKGRLELYEETVSVRELSLEVLRLLQQTTNERDLQIHASLFLRYAEDTIWVDKRMVRQVLLNILSNAAKFTKDGGQITLDGKTSADGLDFVISDNGIGIEPGELGRVFEPFQQAGNSLSRTNEGAGLGLALSRRLMQLHGGDLNLESRVNEGTSVTVHIPKYRTSSMLETRRSIA